MKNKFFIDLLTILSLVYKLYNVKWKDYCVFEVQLGKKWPPSI